MSHCFEFKTKRGGIVRICDTFVDAGPADTYMPVPWLEALLAGRQELPLERRVELAARSRRMVERLRAAVDRVGAQEIEVTGAADVAGVFALPEGLTLRVGRGREVKSRKGITAPKTLGERAAVLAELVQAVVVLETFAAALDASIWADGALTREHRG